MSSLNYRHVVFLFLLTLPCMLHAQKRLESLKVDTSGRVETFGPNRRIFAQAVASVGLFADNGDPGARTRRAYSFQAGGRMKLKLWSWEALTLDVYWKMQRWNLEQKPGKLLPDGNLHQRELIVTHSLSGDFCNRINIGRRGDVLGTYVDLGVYGDYVFHSVHVMKDLYLDPAVSGKESQLTKNFGLPYMAPLNYGFKARAGNGWMNIFAMYRVSGIFKNEYTSLYPQLPRITIGIEIGTE
ncbi:MAG: hypothetical protein FD123_1476 [Bacteroidetes bacterium]|nr:MAG: hypothetical protein FD123_1476 [Bacteroidota bacterium]